MPTDPVTVRAAVEADRAAVLALAPRLAEGVAPWRDPEEAGRAGRRWLEGSLGEAAAGTGAVFVAVTTGGQTETGAEAGTAAPFTSALDGAEPAAGVVGVISVNATRHFTGEHDGYIGELVVAEPAARRGVGRALIEAAEAWARGNGLANLTLHTGAYNTVARAFYASLGFAEEEVRLTRPIGP